MAGSSNPSTALPPPKILLTKPGLLTGGTVACKIGRGSGDDEAASIQSRLPSVASLNLLSDSWDFHIDRFLPFLTENTDFTVVGVIGPPGVGKSIIMNELYGFDGISPGMLPPFAIQSEDNRAMARHVTTGMEPRVSVERLILLDTQPVFSPSVLSEMIRSDGSSTVPVLSRESLSAELAHEIMGIQLGVLLVSICHVLLVVSEGVHDIKMWRLMLTVDMLKHGLPDPSLLLSHSQSSTLGSDREKNEKVKDSGEEYMAAPVYVHTKLHEQELAPCNIPKLKEALGLYFKSSSFARARREHVPTEPTMQDLFTIPFKSKDDSPTQQHQSYNLALSKLRNQVLSMNYLSFARPISERDWLRSSAKIWELVKGSPVIADYSRTLQSSGMFRR